MRGYMKGIIVFMVLAFAVAGCTRVQPGYAGIWVDNYGDQRGVDDFPIKTGRVWFNPFTHDVYKFPTFIQQYRWTGEEEFEVNATEGAKIRFDVSTALTFQEDMIPSIFVEFRRSPDQIINEIVRDIMEREFVRKASNMRAVDIVGDGKSDLIDHVEESVREELGPLGIDLRYVTIVGNVRVDETVERSINAVLTAAQQAIEAQNRIAQAEAEAQQRIERARGDSLSFVIEASGQAEANRLLSESITNDLIEYQKANRWDGILPQVTGSSTPLIDLRPGN